MKLFNQKNFAGAALAAVLLCLGWGAPAARAGVQISMGYPLSATPCDTLSVTTTVVNAGATLSQLQVSEQLPGGSASYSYVTNSMQVTAPGLPTLTNESSVLTIVNGTNLVFNLANLQSTNGLTNLVLSEVFPGAAANQSWFEIYNPTPNAISTLGWSVRDARPGSVSRVQADWLRDTLSPFWAKRHAERRAAVAAAPNPAVALAAKK